LPQLKIEMDLVETGNAMKRAIKSGAKYSLKITTDKKLLIKKIETSEEKSFTSLDHFIREFSC